MTNRLSMMSAVALGLFGLLQPAWGQTTEAEPASVKLVVLPLQSSALQPTAVDTLNELLATAVRRLGKHEVLAKSDIDAMLGLENLKDQLGCDDVACAAELGGALGANLLLAGRVAKLGDSIIFVLKLIDAKEQRVVNSVKHKASNDENLYDVAVEEAVLQLFGLKQAAVAPTAAAPAPDLMRSFISNQDWQRYNDYKTQSGRDLVLSEWVHEQNKESTVLLIAEIAAGSLLALSAGEAFNSFEPKVGGAPLIGAIGLFGLGALILVDYLDIGNIEVTR